MRFEGTLKTWNDERGFGFIELIREEEEVFVHITSFPRRLGRPQVGQVFSFEVELGPQGKRAKNVKPFRMGVSYRKVHREPSAAGLTFIFLFILLFVVVTFIWGPPLVLGLVYIAASLITFLTYKKDKAAAQHGDWRTPENRLHLLALAGGWPGALVAQYHLRHKSTKPEFRLVFWITVIFNVAGFIIVCSPMAQGILAAMK